MKKLLAVLLCCLLLAGCSGNRFNEDIQPTDATTATEQTLQTDATEPETTGQTEPPVTVSDDIVTFTVYTPNETLDGFIAEEVTGEKLSVLEALIDAGVLNENVEVNSVALEGTALSVDMNSAFAEQVYTMGTTGEHMLMGCLVNTFLSAYNAETLTLTVEGEILESGHIVYDFPMEFFQ